LYLFFLLVALRSFGAGFGNSSRFFNQERLRISNPLSLSFPHFLSLTVVNGGECGGGGFSPAALKVSVFRG